MTLTQPRCLVAIAEAGLNITLAAERVHATQPGMNWKAASAACPAGCFSASGRVRACP